MEGTTAPVMIHSEYTFGGDCIIWIVLAISFIGVRDWLFRWRQIWDLTHSKHHHQQQPPSTTSSSTSLASPLSSTCARLQGDFNPFDFSLSLSANASRLPQQSIVYLPKGLPIRRLVLLEEKVVALSTNFHDDDNDS